jgi:hypothetical protein
MSSSLVSLLAMLFAFVPPGLPGTLGPIWGIQFQASDTPLGIAVLLNISVRLAQANNQNFILMRGRVDAQVETRDFKLQHAVVYESTNPRRYVYAASRNAPLCSYQFSALRRC